jgi:cell division transport system permease protein
VKLRTLRYLTAEGFRGMRRHRGLTLTAVVTMTASLLVLGVFLLTSYNLRRAIQELESRKEVVVYLRDGMTPEDYHLFENRIEMHPAVAAVQFVSREEAWDQFSKTLEVEGLLETLGTNPLPDSYRLELKPEARDAATLTAMAEEVEKWDEVEEVLAGGEWVGRLDRFSRNVLLFTAAIGFAVGLSILAIVSNTVRLTVVARQDLIHIMRVVGASEGFIRVPFLSEGILQAFLAGLLSLGGLYVGTRLLAGHLEGVAFLSPLWCSAFLALAMILGLLGSALSVRHVLHQVRL